MDSSLNILAVAQEEYMSKLNDILIPFLLTNFENIYNVAVKDSNGKNTLLRFQEYLRDVKTWNNSTIKERTDEIRQSFSQIKELIAAIVVGYVKIMSAIRLNDVSNQKIPIKLPRTEDFIFRVYEKNAEAYYKDPYWFQKNLSEDEKLDKVQEINAKIIRDVLKSIIPIDKILETYIAGTGTFPDVTEVESQIGDDTPDPEPIDAEEHMEDENLNTNIDSEPPMVPSVPPPPPPPPEDEEVNDELHPENDIKTVPVTGNVAADMPEQQDDEEFDDGLLVPFANDQRKKNFV